MSELCSRSRSWFLYLNSATLSLSLHTGTEATKWCSPSSRCFVLRWLAAGRNQACYSSGPADQNRDQELFWGLPRFGTGMGPEWGALNVWPRWRDRLRFQYRMETGEECTPVLLCVREGERGRKREKGREGEKKEREGGRGGREIKRGGEKKKGGGGGGKKERDRQI